MNDSSAPALPSEEDIVNRLAQLRSLQEVPREELVWLARHGSVRRFDVGHVVVEPGDPVDGFYVLFSGRLVHYRDAGGVYRKVMEWRGGEVTGMLPYSRLTVVTGRSVVEEPLEALRLPLECVPEIPMACPHLAATLVHAMVDRARTFRSSDLQIEKMASLGKLAAGLAHELNNPASAAARSARLVTEALAAADRAARALGAAGLTDSEMERVERVQSACTGTPLSDTLSPLQRADREEEVAEWLIDRGVDPDLAAPLADTAVTLELLDQLAEPLSGERLSVALQWLAAGCTVRALARDIERAASRMHALVSAVKGFTYVDRAAAPEPVDVVHGIRDTLAVLAAKARSKSASIRLDAPDDLPRVRGSGGELNQIWANLIDNALDAIHEGGHVTVSVRKNGASVVVRVVDDGPGIPDALQRQIFDPFFTTKEVGQGTGLGLDIVRRLVDQNDGRIDVESEPGRTEFRVTVPSLD